MVVAGDMEVFSFVTIHPRTIVRSMGLVDSVVLTVRSMGRSMGLRSMGWARKEPHADLQEMGRLVNTAEKQPTSGR